jgi:hypothetical protein
MTEERSKQGVYVLARAIEAMNNYENYMGEHNPPPYSPFFGPVFELEIARADLDTAERLGVSVVEERVRLFGLTKLMTLPQ